jgi:Predicted ATP-grasp enzyme
MISILIDPDLQYPDAADHFSPDERFPEYRYEHVAGRPNAIYGALRNVFIQSGLDAEHLGTPLWNPLGDFIQPGSRVFLLCNFMQERRPDEPLEDFRSRCSHGSVIRALADYILIATGDDGRVSIGNAPIQFCDWEAVLRDTETRDVLQFYQSVGAPVSGQDLRLTVTDATAVGAIKSVKRRNEEDGVHVRLDRDSLFDELDRRQSNRYRVMNYDPRRTEAFHSAGHHEYVINRHILEADVIFSAVKLKTHEKTGITCAIKGMVGTVAHKDSLPHHRYGPPSVGGDEYPSANAELARLATGLHERVQRTAPDTAWGSSLRVAYKVFRRAIRRRTPVVEGAWHGNDTTWRMVVDVARIVTYADATGGLHESPRRRTLVLTDGIVGGEGDGPYMSTAVHSGILAFSDDLSAADHVNAILMGFDPGRMPMVRESARLERYPLATTDPMSSEVTLNARPMTVAELEQMERTRYEPQEGWRDALSSRTPRRPSGIGDVTGKAAPAVVFPADRPAALGIARSLGPRGIPVHAVDADASAIGMVSRYVSACPLPDGDLSDENRLQTLLDLGRRLGQRAVLFPVSDDAVLLCSGHRSELQQYYSFVMPDHDTVTGMLTKDGLHKLARQHDIPAPQMFSVESQAEAERIAGELPYPVIIKPIFSPSWLKPEIRALLQTSPMGGAPKVALCGDSAELLETYRQIAVHDPRMIFEEIIPGEDERLLYYCFYMNRHSEPLAAFAGVKHRILPVGFGSASFVRSVHDPSLEEISLKLLSGTRYQGLGGIEFKRDSRDESYKLIEFNARIGLWDSLSIRCGVDIPYIAYCDTLEQPVKAQLQYRSGVSWVDFQRDMRAFFVYRGRGQLTFPRWIRSLMGEKDWAVFSPDDWKPAMNSWMEQSRLVGGLIKRKLRPL